ncbi:hypothetical protein EVAR_90253_1 [Eumeta japonica]|uniref:Uncharacterized protein n=1 Tax=Eumeta variegata TaxID=151549 RepID=A0A4C2A4I7_EUMVA|nr:hypothetical protein EVAR_90253_1 [Eumeta japonica]
MSNGNASPEEVGKCDKVTPKKLTQKTRMRGRRPHRKNKRAILPTQAEEPEYMHGVNSPEIIPMNGESKDLLIKTSRRRKLQGITGTQNDFIISGNMKTLPLQGQSVYALVDEEENYEPGLVLGEENSSGAIIYRCTTDGLKTKGTVGRKRLASESSELSESSNSAPPVRLEEVAGVEPEVQRTPRKIDGVKGILLIPCSANVLAAAPLRKIQNWRSSKTTRTPCRSWDLSHHRQPTIRGNAFPVNLCRYTRKPARVKTEKFTDTILLTCPPRSRYWKKMGVRISKEKRKAERTASNQALSLNMMKFLNQTASGSTVPSESIASTSTQQTSEIPLGNAPDALSTESELQLDVELGSCSSQSKWTLKFCAVK